MAIGDHKRVSGGFWRRLAATWVDSFVIYAVAAFLVSLAATAQTRISLEPLYLALMSVYSVALLAWRGQTVGKMLLGIAVTTKAGGKLSVQTALLREALGKWGIAVAMPVTLGRALVGQAWVPTVYDALILLPALLVLIVYSLVAKQTWYDHLAGTAVERVSGVEGLARPALALAGLAVLGVGAKATEFVVLGWVPCRLALYHSTDSTAPYVAFLKQGQAPPVDYVIGLFDRYDVVVLCERPHPESSQWEFIHELVRDPRFIDGVGHVFTEYGVVAQQDYLEGFMATDGLDEQETHERVVHIMRDWAVWPVWTNTNFYTYLTRLYQLNQSLPRAKRVQHHFTDVAVGWDGLTRAEYEVYRRSLVNRDEDMARRVIKEMDRLAGSKSTPAKCLVVMNYRHAFDLTGRSLDVRRMNTYEYLKDAFGDRAANVLLNTEIMVLAPTAGGLWDAAFEEAGNGPAGFDLDGSPFGDDRFDMYPFLPELRGMLTYQDVFTGYVFVHPLKEQYLEEGIPGYYAGFEEEALRRAELVSKDYRRAIAAGIVREKEGRVPAKKELPRRKIQSLIEIGLLGVNGVGFLIGVGILVSRRQRFDEKT